MSLQTAPLGQLSGLNLPYSIPRYEKPKSILQQALAAALVNVASSTGKNVANNAFSRDYATEADGGKAGFMSKLISGPKVDARLNQQRQTYAHEDASQRSGQEFTRSENETQRGFTSGENTKRQEFDLSRDKSRNEFDTQRDVLNNTQADTRVDKQMSHTEKLSKQSQEYQMLMEQVKAALQNGGPAGQVQSEEARRLKLGNDYRETIQGGRGGQVPGQPQVDSGLLNYKKGAQGAPQVPVDPQQAAMAEFLAPNPGAEDNYGTYPQGQPPLSERSIEPNTLQQVPTSSLTLPEGTPTNAHDVIADLMRSVGYGATNLVRPSNWQGDSNSASYHPEGGALPKQLKSRYDALRDKNGSTALHLQKLMQLLATQQPSQ